MNSAWKLYEGGLGPSGALNEINDFNEFLSTKGLDKSITSAGNDAQHNIWHLLESAIMKSIRLYNVLCESTNNPGKKREDIKESDVAKLREKISKYQKKLKK